MLIVPRLKRSSIVLNKAERRAAALKSISFSLDLGNGLTLETFSELIQDMQDKLEAYNMALSAVDAAHSKVEEVERSLRDLCELCYWALRLNMVKTALSMRWQAAPAGASASALCGKQK